MKKVLIIAPFFFEKHRWMISAYKMATELAKQCPVVVLTTGKPSYEERGSQLKMYRMYDIFLPDPVNYSIVPGLFFRLWKIIRKEKPDIFVVNKNMFFTSFSIVLLKILRKKVFTVIDAFPGIDWKPRNSFVRIVMMAYARVIGMPLLKMSNVVVLLHEGLIPIATKFHLNYTVIHNGVDFDKFQNNAPPVDIHKHENEIIITYIGRLESVKGYYDLLSVAENLVKINKNIKFVFVGNTDGKEEVVKRYSSNFITFLGHREDIPSILRASDIFVLPSYSEGLPNALMEAMASGVACIASNVGGVKVLISDSENGLVFEPGNKQELALRIQTLIDDKVLRLKIGEQARKKIEKLYNWRSIANQYLELFNRS